MSTMSADSECFVTQRTFRTLLQAMSHPGRIYPLDQKQGEGGAPLLAEGLAMTLRTLLDQEVRFCVLGDAGKEMQPTISALTGCPAAEIPAADFLLVFGGGSKHSILQAKRGTLEYPDSGATVIYTVESLQELPAGEDAAGFFTPVAVLKGPGIKDEIAVAISGMNADELVDISEITSEFPMGIDCVFVDGRDRVMCIPRSTKIEVR